MKNYLIEVKSYVCLRPFLNGLSLFLGVLFLGLMSCPSTTYPTSSSPTKDNIPPTVEDNIPPTVAISTKESLEIDKIGTITFTFSEKVTNFTPDDIQFLPTSFSLEKGKFVTNNQKSYSLQITPKLAGTLTVTVQANSFYDLSGNKNTNSFSNNFSVEDKSPPTVAISTKENLEIGETGTITFTFSENVTNFILGDIQLLMNGGGVTPDRVKFVTNSQKNYSLEIKPTIAGTLTVTVPANSFYDLSGNQNTNNFSTNFWVRENTPPTVNISSEALIEGESAHLSFVFSENVNNFTPDDIQFLSNKANGVNNVVKGNFVTNSQKSYSLQITPKEEGTLYVSIPTNSFYDLSGNQNNEAYSNSFTVLDSSTTTHIISFKLNGGSFISPQITNLKVVDNTAIEQTKLGGILSYPPTGPKQNAVTRGIFEWRTNETTYDFSNLVSSDLTLEAVWSNSCGKVETFHPADRNDLKTYTDAAVGANATTNLNHIDTSAITDMNNLFFFKTSFNGEIGCWNTAKVNNMQSIFDNAQVFNRDIGKWDVANVTTMNNMFGGANAFNQDISTWNVGNVNNMKWMFLSARAFNQDISTWNVGNVNNMKWMFLSARAFNQDISTWNVANVNNMYRMFADAYAFNQDISTWNTANVTNMGGMFYAATLFNQDISGWNVANVTDMSYMFNEAWAFNQDVSRWNVANVNNMRSMFSNATAFNKDLSGWDVDKVTYYGGIFTGSAMEEKNKPAKFRTSFTISFNLNGGMFSSPQTNLIVSPGGSISQATLDKIQVNYPDVGPKEGVTGVSREFVEWRVGGAKYNSSPITSDMTLGAVWSNSCGKIETVHPANRNDLKTYTDAAVSNSTTNLNHIDTSAITDMRSMFNGKNSFDGDIACWNISKVNNMNNMFSSANAFNGDISNWNVANVTDMSSMFQNANAFNQDISNWNVSKVTDMSSMFQNATVFNKDISSWGVSNVTDMSSMFQYARAFDQDLSTWPVSNVTAHDNMFTGSPMESETSQQPTFSSP